MSTNRDFFLKYPTELDTHTRFPFTTVVGRKVKPNRNLKNKQNQDDRRRIHILFYINLAVRFLSYIVVLKMWFGKIDDPEALVQCPYNDAHMVRNKRMQYHIIDCRKVNITLVLLVLLIGGMWD